MKKILILRTFQAPKVWEPHQGIEFVSATYRQSSYFDQILKWEPDYSLLTTKDIAYAIGIYTEKYFSSLSVNPAAGGVEATYKGTSGENQPSIIDMMSIPSMLGAYKFMNIDRRGIYFFYRVKRKLTGFNRSMMLDLDKSLIDLKKIELSARYGSAPDVAFTPLSFCLDEETVTELLSNYDAALHQ